MKFELGGKRSFSEWVYDTEREGWEWRGEKRPKATTDSIECTLEFIMTSTVINSVHIQNED